VAMAGGRVEGAAYTGPGAVSRAVRAVDGGGWPEGDRVDGGPVGRRAEPGKYAMNRTGVDRGFRRFHLVLVGLVPLWLGTAAVVHCAASEATGQGVAEQPAGWRHLREHAYLPADFDQEVFDDLWTTWEEPSRSRAEAADVAERRRMAMDRYGLVPDPADPSRSLQYVVDDAGRWTMSCLACHQGTVAGKAVPGVPNTRYALETLTEEVRQVKIRQGKPLGHMDLGSLVMPLGTTVGTTNSVMFGVALMRHRDPDLTIVPRPPRFDLAHHDVDAPAWWHYATRKRLYADAFAPKGHRVLMQFILVKENGPERFREWEGEFRDIESWLSSLEPPAWEGAVDTGLADRGRGLFREHCSHCHGTYDGPRGGPGRSYPERIVPIEEIGTDRVRFDALTVNDRRALNVSWFEERSAVDGIDDPAGYVAPPLDGVWASAPYFHNGSVPTLWHVLHPEKRPRAWRRLDAPGTLAAEVGTPPPNYDADRVGLAVEERDAVPEGRLPAIVRRTWFDTTKPGKGAAGHEFFGDLDDDGRRALLEYLKTL